MGSRESGGEEEQAVRTDKSRDVFCKEEQRRESSWREMRGQGAGIPLLIFFFWLYFILFFR